MNGRYGTSGTAGAQLRTTLAGHTISRLAQLGLPFWMLWFGETITMFGTQLVQFALNVWIFEETQSVLSFAGAVAAGTLPAVLATPFAGIIVDRVDRLHVMIAADAIAALMTLVLFAILTFGTLEIVHLYIFTAVASFVGAFQMPAYHAALADMVRQDLLTRATGAMGVSATTLGILVPTIAAWMLVHLGLSGLVLLDLVLFVAGTLFVWRAFVLTRRRRSPSDLERSPRALAQAALGNFVDSLRYFQRNPAMRGLLFYTLLQAVLMSLALAMVVPLILSNLSPKALGLALSSGALGALCGSLVMVLIESPRLHMKVILLCDAICASCIAVAGVVTSLVAYCSIQFVAGAAASVASSCAYALWISRVPKTQLGSILVVVGTVTMACTALTVLGSSYVVERVFEPAMHEGGLLAPTLGSLLGIGDGRGIGLMFLICGLLGLAVSLYGLRMPQVRGLLIPTPTNRNSPRT